MFEEIQKECDLVLFNNLVYLAETNGHANPSLWVVEKLDSMGVETTTTRHDDNSLTLVRSKGYTMEIHNLILNELDPQMTPEAMAEAFHVLVANAAGSGRSKQWVIDSLTEVGATIVSDDEIDLTPDHIAAVEILIDPPAEASDEELQILYKALEARAELIGLDADALSQNHGAINPDYELTPFVLAELTRQVDQWEKVFGPGANETLTPEALEEAKKPVETVTETPAETATTADNSVKSAITSTVDADPKPTGATKESDVTSTGTSNTVADTAPLPSGGAAAPEPVKKKGGRKATKTSALKRIEKIITELKGLLQEVEILAAGDDVQG